MHAPDGPSQHQSCLAHEHKPHHPDAHALPWHQHDTDRSDAEPSVSSKHVAETESPKYHVLRGVQEFFLFSRTLLTPPPGPLIQSPLSPPSKPGITAGAPCSTRTIPTFLTPFTIQVSNMTISRKAPSGNLTSKPTSSIPKRQCTLQKSTNGPRRVSKKKQQLN